MKILIVADASSKYNPAFSYERGFKKLGNEVRIFDSTQYFKIGLVNRIINKIVSIPVYFGIGNLNSALINFAKEVSPDFILFLEPRQIKPETLIQLRSICSGPFLMRNDDAVFRVKNLSTLFYKTLGMYDCAISMNSNNVDELKRIGAKRAEFVPLGVDEILRYRVEPSSADEKEKLGADVVFIGTYANEGRESYLENLCRDGFNVKVYGNSWEKAHSISCLKSKRAIMYRPVVGEEMSKVINSSKIVIAFLRHHNRDVQTVRTYEIPACGGFMLHERTAEATNLFKEGEEAEFFDSYEEMKKKIEYYLGHDEERKKIADAGHARAHDPSYSYQNRVEQVFNIAKNLLNGK